MEKNLGHATAYGYAKSKGYSGTEEEFAELMANYASVGQSAEWSAEQAAASATSASRFAATASQAAQEATSKASESVAAASTATTKASEAAESATMSSNAKNDAVTAKTAAETARGKAEDAQAAAEQSASEAAESARTLVIDSTLTQPGQAAGAKKTGDEITSLKENLTYIFKDTTENKSGKSFLPFGNFQHYGLRPDGSFWPQQKYRVSNDNPMTFDRDIIITVAKGFGVGYIQFFDGVAGTWQGWFYSEKTIMIKAGLSFILQIKRVTENTSEIADVKEFTDAVTFTMPEKLGYDEFDLSNMTWELGSITSYGVDLNGDSYKQTVIRTKYFPIALIKNILFASYVDDNFTHPNVLYGVHFYDSNFNHIWSGADYFRYVTTFPVPDNAAYIKINCRPNMTVPVTPEDHKYYKVYVKYADEKNAYQTGMLYAQNYGAGNSIAYGDRINFNTYKSAMWNCSIDKYIDYISDSFADLAQYSLSNNQSIAIYGDYIFFLLDFGDIVIANRETGELVSRVTTPITTRNHHNSAQFSDYFYSQGDEFPLLFVARCGNTTQAGEYDTCLIYRIVQQNGVFSVTLVNTIFTDITTYGTSWCVDVNERSISQVGYKNGTYQVTTNNPVYFWKWRLPLFEDIISGNNIVLKANDCIQKCYIPYVLLQAAHAQNGNVWITCAYNNKQQVFVVDLVKAQVVSRIELIETYEIEGIDVYNEAIYVSQRRNNADNPLTIYKIIC